MVSFGRRFVWPSTIAASPASIGATTDRFVEFDAAINESGSYVAMLHLDTNGNQTYDFVTTNGSADGPYIVDGAAVVDAGEVTVANETATGEN